MLLLFILVIVCVCAHAQMHTQMHTLICTLKGGSLDRSKTCSSSKFEDHLQASTGAGGEQIANTPNPKHLDQEISCTDFCGIYFQVNVLIASFPFRISSTSPEFCRHSICKQSSFIFAGSFLWQTKGLSYMVSVDSCHRMQVFKQVFMSKTYSLGLNAELIAKACSFPLKCLSQKSLVVTE